MKPKVGAVYKSKSDTGSRLKITDKNSEGWVIEQDRRAIDKRSGDIKMTVVTRTVSAGLLNTILLAYE